MLIGADLQDRRLPIAAGKRHKIGLGQDPGDDHALPSQPLDAEGNANRAMNASLLKGDRDLWATMPTLHV